MYEKSYIYWVERDGPFHIERGLSGPTPYARRAQNLWLLPRRHRRRLITLAVKFTRVFAGVDTVTMAVAGMQAPLIQFVPVGDDETEPPGAVAGDETETPSAVAGDETETPSAVAGDETETPSAVASEALTVGAGLALLAGMPLLASALMVSGKLQELYFSGRLAAEREREYFNRFEEMIREVRVAQATADVGLASAVEASDRGDRTEQVAERAEWRADDAHKRLDKLEEFIRSAKESEAPFTELGAVLNAGYKAWASADNPAKRAYVMQALNSAFFDDEFSSGIRMRLLAILADLMTYEVHHLEAIAGLRPGQPDLLYEGPEVESGRYYALGATSQDSVFESSRDKLAELGLVTPRGTQTMLVTREDRVPITTRSLGWKFLRFIRGDKCRATHALPDML